MKLTNLSTNLLLFTGLSVALVARVTPKDVYSDYEDVVDPGIPGVTVVALPIYDELHYDNFRAVQELPLEEATTYPDGTGCALGLNGSSVTSQYTGSPVASFKPNYASFGCYLGDKTAFVIGVNCTIEVTAFHPDGTEYPNRQPCLYTGLGKVQKCDFPSTWIQVGKLSFSVVTSALITGVGVTLADLLEPLIGPGLGNIGYIMDDLDSFYTCVPGKFNDAATGLCV